MFDNVLTLRSHCRKWHR